MRVPAPRYAAFLALSLALAARDSAAQELEPRSYAAAPTGLNLLVGGYVRSTGEVLPDPSAPISNIEARIDAALVGYARTFDFLGRSSSIAIAAPYVNAHVIGLVSGTTPGHVDRTGLGDTRVRLAVNLYGSPAQSPAEFAREEPHTTFGASITVAMPTGQYDSGRLINIGAHRWAVKPEIGFAYPYGRWVFEGYAGVWIFSDNGNYFGGRLREQDPMHNLQAHISYTFRPRLWLAFDSTWYDGGETSIDGVSRLDRQSNTRLGATLSLPLTARQSLKLGWSNGVSTRIGSDFDTWGVFWTYAWADSAR